jgi:hypothetical protein
MISAYQAGFVAGSAELSMASPVQRVESAEAFAQAILARRKKLGVPPWAPEEEFLRGCIEGLRQPAKMMDGLVLFVAQKARHP